MSSYITRKQLEKSHLAFFQNIKPIGIISGFNIQAY
jgi:hypothetical protein